MLPVEAFQVLEHGLRCIAQADLRQDGLGAVEDGLIDQRIDCAGRPDPLIDRVTPGRGFELAGRFVIDQRAGVHDVGEDPPHLPHVPESAHGRTRAIIIEMVSDLLHRVAGVDELIEDAPDRGDLVLRSQRQRHALVLDAFFLVKRQDVQAVALLIQKQPVKTKRGFAPGPVALLGNLHAPMKNLGAEFLAVLRRPKPLELHVHRVERIVGPRHAQRGVDDLLAVLLALGAVCGG